MRKRPEKTFFFLEKQKAKTSKAGKSVWKTNKTDIFPGEQDICCVSFVLQSSNLFFPYVARAAK